MTQERERAGEKPTLSSCPHCRNGIKRVMLTDSVLAHEFSDGERAWCEQCVDLHAHQQAMQRLEDWIRERVALGHGCDLVYGDDGELQCSNLVRHGELLDFRRMPMEKVFEVDARCKLEAAAEFMKRRESEQQALREPPIVDPMHKVSESNTLCYDEARDSQDYAEALEASSRRLKTLLQERDTGRETVEALSLSVEALESELLLKQQALREAQAAAKAANDNREAVVKHCVEALGNACEQHTKEILAMSFDEFAKAVPTECSWCLAQQAREAQEEIARLDHLWKLETARAHKAEGQHWEATTELVELRSRLVELVQLKNDFEGIKATFKSRGVTCEGDPKCENLCCLVHKLASERDEATQRAQALEARVKQLEEQLAHAQQR